MRQIAESVASLKEASETTGSSIAQMDASVKQVEENARKAAAIAEEVRGDAESGRDSVQATVAGVGVIKQAMGATAAAVSSLSGKTENIGNIVKMIDEVADQTNLLALNAAIIAAQSGESGRGFAVVAQEIKELATRTAVSTREIAAVIQSVQVEIGEAATALTEANRSVDEGERLSVRSGEALIKIVSGIGQVSIQVQGIARATREQAAGSQVVQAAMERISSRVSQIATATREQGRGSDLIMAASERMRGLTDQVHATTREQSKTSKALARNTEQMNAMVRQISRACDEQTTSSDQIVQAMEAIQTSTRTNLQATHVMEEGANGLAKQISLLQQEMNTFRIADKG
jgi:methyl-accepting chemotaxis protein